MFAFIQDEYNLSFFALIIFVFRNTASNNKLTLDDLRLLFGIGMNADIGQRGYIPSFWYQQVWCEIIAPYLFCLAFIYCIGEL